MSKRDEFNELPVETTEKPKPETKQEKMKRLADEIKDIYGIDVQPTKNVAYKWIKALEFFQENYKFKYNEEIKEMFCHNGSSDKFVPLEDRHESEFRRKLIFKNIALSKNDIRDLIFDKKICEYVSPVKDYFFSLAKWDGKTNHIERMLQQVYLAHEDERQVFVKHFTKWFVGMTACILDDMAVNQQCLVLYGGQTGQKKTTFLNSLVPIHLQLDSLYTGSFNFDDIDYRKFIYMKWLINIDEMASISRHDEKILKTVLTSQKFDGRLKYGRYDTKAWRRASFCGSTNNKKFLTDETGNRRYLVFEVENIDTLPDKDQQEILSLAYAQAFALYKSGFKYWFDSEDIREINKRNEDFRNISNEENLVYEYLQVPTPEEEKNAAYNSVCFMSTTSINSYLVGKVGHINVNETTVKRLDDVLKKLGFVYKSRRIEGHASPYKCWAVKKIETPTFIDESKPEEEMPI